MKKSKTRLDASVDLQSAWPNYFDGTAGKHIQPTALCQAAQSKASNFISHIGSPGSQSHPFPSITWPHQIQTVAGNLPNDSKCTYHLSLITKNDFGLQCLILYEININWPHGLWTLCSNYKGTETAVLYILVVMLHAVLLSFYMKKAFLERHDQLTGFLD